VLLAYVEKCRTEGAAHATISSFSAACTRYDIVSEADLSAAVEKLAERESGS
jgi:hypothetical protein